MTSSLVPTLSNNSLLLPVSNQFLVTPKGFILSSPSSPIPSTKRQLNRNEMIYPMKQLHNDSFERAHHQHNDEIVSLGEKKMLDYIEKQTRAMEKLAQRVVEQTKIEKHEGSNNVTQSQNLVRSSVHMTGSRNNVDTPSELENGEHEPKRIAAPRKRSTILKTDRSEVNTPLRFERSEYEPKIIVLPERRSSILKTDRIAEGDASSELIRVEHEVRTNTVPKRRPSILKNRSLY